MEKFLKKLKDIAIHTVLIYFYTLLAYYDCEILIYFAIEHFIQGKNKSKSYEYWNGRKHK